MWVLSFNPASIPVMTDGTFIVDKDGNNVDGITFPSFSEHENLNAVFEGDCAGWKAYNVPVGPISFGTEDEF